MFSLLQCNIFLLLLNNKEKGKTVEVSVLLNYEQARLEHVDLATVRDRFQVVAVGIENPTREGLTELWSTARPECVTKITLKCKFVNPNLVKTSTTESPAGALDMTAQSFLSPTSGGDGDERGKNNNHNSNNNGGGSAASSAVTKASPTLTVFSRSPNSPRDVDNLSLSGEKDPDGAMPTMEQAKDRYKSEMSLARMKKELAVLREEKSALEARLLEREQKMFLLEEDLTRLRAKETSTRQQSKSTSILEVLMYIFLFFVFVLVFNRVVGIDVLVQPFR